MCSAYNPFQRRLLVQHAPVTRAVDASLNKALLAELWVRHPAEGTSTVIVVDEDNSFVCHPPSIEQCISRRRLGRIRPHYDRQLGIGGIGRTPDVEVETVLVYGVLVSARSRGTYRAP